MVAYHLLVTKVLPHSSSKSHFPTSRHLSPLNTPSLPSPLDIHAWTFSSHQGMGMLVVDTTTAKAAVFEWDEDDGVSEDPISSSLTAYLEDYRNRLLSGQCEFLEDCGVVEKMGAKAGAAASRK